MQIRRTAAALTAAAALSVSGVAMATSASAAPIITGGLVNVTVTDVLTGDILSNNTVPITVAAQVCGVTVQALAVLLGPSGTIADCDQSVTTITTVTQRRR